MSSFGPLVNHYYVDLKDNDIELKKICRPCNCFAKFSGTSGEILYIKFIHSAMYTIGPYPEDIDLENFYFNPPSRTKMKCIYQSILREGNGDHKYLRFTYL